MSSVSRRNNAQSARQTVARQQPDSKIKEAFWSKLHQLSVQAVCGRRYLRLKQLNEWLEEGSISDRNVNNVTLLLRDTYDGRARFQPAVERITDGEQSCLHIFCILVELNLGHLVETFQSHGLVDAKLPFDLLQLRRVEEKAKLRRGIAEKFDETQWRYRPLKFGLHDQHYLAWSHILPICRKDLINSKGGTAKVYQILVQEEFVDEKLKAIVPESCIDDPQFGQCYYFALKTYDASNQDIFDNEREAFRGLEDNRGMIQYLLHYSHTELSSYAEAASKIEEGMTGGDTHNIVLVYGDLDLQEHFERFLPPVLGDELLEFWSNLFLIAHAVKDIHTIRRSTGTIVDSWVGWHADIKPDNILSVRGEFKLADPGFARFERQEGNRTNGPDSAQYIGGTATFGAPECFLEGDSSIGAGQRTVSQLIDIWSLGCVFSVAATWVVLGLAGLDQFRKVRTDATDRVKRPDIPTTRPTATDKKLGKSDMFHDGYNVLGAVREWHKFLRTIVRSNDRLTSQILDLVDERMLVGKADARISASELCEALHTLQRPQSSMITDTLDSCIQNALEEVEMEREAAEQEEQKKQTRIRNAISLLQNKMAKNHDTSLLNDMNALLSLAGMEDLLYFSSVDHAEWQRSRLGHRSVGIRSPHASKPGTPSMRTTHRSIVANRSTRHSQQRKMSYLSQRHERHGSHTAHLPRVSEDVLLIPSVPPSGYQSGHPEQMSPTQGSNSRHSLSSGIARSGTSRSLTPTTSARSIKKKLTSMPWRKPKGDERLRRYYNDRDIMFVVDNGSSMIPHWNEVKMRLLSYVDKARHVDKDGMDLKFTCGPTTFKPSNNPDVFAKAMEKPEHQPNASIETNMREGLGGILAEYLRQFKIKGSKTRRLTIIVLTDGLWRGMAAQNDLAVDNIIVNFCNELRDLQDSPLEEDSRRVSIQFARFGHDKAACNRLRRLDDQLKFRGVPDIVDTRPADADLYDIFCGSLDEQLDDKLDEEGENQVFPGETNSEEPSTY